MLSEFDQLCGEALASAGDVTPAAREQIIEDLRLRFEHPDNYVAYVDQWRAIGGIRRLCREIIAVSPDLRDIHQALGSRTKEQRRAVIIDYVDPLVDDLVIPHHISER